MSLGRDMPDEAARPSVVLASAAPGAGKSTAEAFLLANGYGSVRIGDIVKGEVDSMVRVHGLAYDESEKTIFRPLLSAWTELRLVKSGPDYWLDLAREEAQTKHPVVYSDVRYPNELAWCAAEGAMTIFIERAGVEVSYLPTEGRLSAHEFDHVIDNGSDDGGEQMLNELARILGLSR